MPENIEKIIGYLQENKSSFSREKLAGTLLKSGYRQEDIDEGIRSAYGNQKAQYPAVASAKTDFWDFHTKKAYFNPSEKWLDVLSGFGFSVLLAVILNIIPILGIILFYVASIFLIAFFSSRRTFIMAGFAFGLVISPIIAGIFMEIIGEQYLPYNHFF